MEKIVELSEILKVRFKDSLYLKQALTHKSFANEKNENVPLEFKDNERFEFLGDSILNLVISDLLMMSFPEGTEGMLSKFRAAIVNETQLASIARKLKFSMDKVPYSLQVYGNTGSASIPLTIAHNYKEMIAYSKKRCLLSGFGVGLSWGTADIVLDNIYCPPVIEC